MTRSHFPSRLYIAIILMFLFLPIFMLVIFSFNDAKFPTLPLSGFTLKWYEEVITDRGFMDALGNSLLVSSLVAALSTFLGFTGAYFFHKLKMKRKRLFLIPILFPIFVPFLLSALAFIIFLNIFNFGQSLFFVIVFHVAIFSPIALVLIFDRLAEVNPDFEHAARDLGATQMQFVTRVLLPIISPVLLSVAALAFILSWDEFVIAWFVSGFDQTLPVKIWLKLGSQLSPEINAIGTIILVTSLFFIFLFQFFSSRRGFKIQ